MGEGKGKLFTGSTRPLVLMVVLMDWWFACAARTSSRVRVSDRTDMNTRTSMMAAPIQAQRQPDCFLSCAMYKT
jgi:hypothetical protein